MYRVFIVLMTLVFVLLVVSIANADMGKIEKSVMLHCAKYKISKQLVMAIIEVESGFNQYSIGQAKEVGLMQLHPKYHKNVSFNIDKNIRQGVKYLAFVKRKCQRDLGGAWFICYNNGPYRRPLQPKKFPYYVKVVRVMRKQWISKVKKKQKYIEYMLVRQGK